MLSTEQQQTVIDNLNLVHFSLKKLGIFPNHPDYEDFFQEGCIGLIGAVSRFDESKGYGFSTFAVPNIQGYVRRYRRDKCNIIRVHRNDYDLYCKMMGLIGQGYHLDDIPEELGISPMKLSKLLSAYSVESLQAELGFLKSDAEKLTVGDMVADWRNDCEDLLTGMTFDEALSKVLSLLKEPDRDICEEWFYARMFGEELRQPYFADKYGVSQAQISRVLKKFKEKLLFYLRMEL